MKKFDLNIEKVLEDWKVFHALREIIANAIDEQVLTRTANIRIYKGEQTKWHIQDFGRGLRYEHLTQNESEEKLKQYNLVIGKFGVGLKDALAVLNRHNIGVLIKSQYGDITLENLSKHGFEDIVTLHAIITAPSDPQITGTEFILDGIKDSDIESAKEFFLLFSDEQLLEKTSYGQVLQKGTGKAHIYINGVRVAQEENFLFSYNITSLTQTMRKALNRERTNVGRTAYTDRVKAMLLDCKNKVIAEMLASDLSKYETGQYHDELNWIDVAVHACRLLNTSGKVIFLTSRELINAKNMVDHAANDGLNIVIVPENVKMKLHGLADIKGNLIRDLDRFAVEWNDSFDFAFIKEQDLTSTERSVFSKTDAILQLVGGKPRKVKTILISDTMRMDVERYQEALGLWEGETGRIIIKRSELRNLEAYSGVLLHELAHAISGASDVSREFECELTTLLGKTASSVFLKSAVISTP